MGGVDIFLHSVPIYLCFIVSSMLFDGGVTAQLLIKLFVVNETFKRCVKLETNFKHH